MLISLDWIKEYTHLPDHLSADELGVKFTMATAEVESVSVVGEHLTQIKVAKVLEIKKHPEADKLNLVTFDIGGESRQVVCGAANVKLGMKTPYAPIGTTLPVGFTLEPKKIRGILSEGMLCSEEELGLCEKSSGIMELPEDAPLGETLLTYWNETRDIIFDIDNKSLTHRPDLWGHYGMAREFASAFNNPLNNPFDEKWSSELLSRIPGGDSPLTVKVHENSAGISYYGLSLKGVKIEDSPQWLKKRLIAVGLRPINNIVDISNYVMLELGIPMHIFDRSQIKGEKVEIKALDAEETFTTLDEIERQMLPGDTMICDSEKSLVIAGIMGGLNSGVTESTTEIFIEVANWKATAVRTVSTRLGLRTDSSQRYEKTLDSKLCKRTMLRALDLVLKLCPQAEVVGSLEYDGINLEALTPLQIDISVEKINSTLGSDIESERIISILENLDFKIIEKNGLLNITVPSYRCTKDIEVDADIIEEVGRMVGYDNIESRSPLVEVTPARLSPAQELDRKIKDYMVFHCKSFEVKTYPMIGEKLLKKASWPSDCLSLNLINSISTDHDRMRESLIPSLLNAAALNAKNYYEYRFFEQGRSYHSDKKTFSKDHYQLGIVYYDKEKTPFLDLVNDVNGLINTCNIPGDITSKHPKFKNAMVDESWLGLHPHEFYNIKMQGKMNGVIFSVHPIVLKNYKIKGHLSIAILDLTNFHERPLKDKTRYRPLPKFPESFFDYTLAIKKDAPVKDIFDSLAKVKIKEITSHRILDIFPGESSENFITMRTTFQDPLRTLPGDFLKSSEEAIVKKLEESGLPLKKA